MDDSGGASAESSKSGNISENEEDASAVSKSDELLKRFLAQQFRLELRIVAFAGAYVPGICCLFDLLLFCFFSAIDEPTLIGTSKIFQMLTWNRFFYLNLVYLMDTQNEMKIFNRWTNINIFVIDISSLVSTDLVFMIIDNAATIPRIATERCHDVMFLLDLLLQHQSKFWL